MSSVRSAIVTGSGGQDGAYLVELLAATGVDVTEVTRSGASRRGGALEPCDLEDASDVAALIAKAQPDACFHLAASTQTTHREGAVLAFNYRSTEALCAAISSEAPRCRLLLAGSSQMFGAPTHAPQDEHTPFAPVTPYGQSKLRAHEAIVAARERGLFAATAILYNHESPRRPAVFVTRKISLTVARIHFARARRLVLGDLDARRDWGHAAEYVEAMRLMLELDSPEDLVLATGETHSVRDLVKAAFAVIECDADKHIDVDPALVRPEHGAERRGDPSRAEQLLGWRATRRGPEIIEEMVRADLARLESGELE